MGRLRTYWEGEGVILGWNPLLKKSASIELFRDFSRRLSSNANKLKASIYNEQNKMQYKHELQNFRSEVMRCSFMS